MGGGAARSSAYIGVLVLVLEAFTISKGWDSAEDVGESVGTHTSHATYPTVACLPLTMCVWCVCWLVM